MGLFQKAVKHDAKLRLAIAGPSGSGKTYSALAIATALGGPIAFVDTEHGSASKYADIFAFDVAEMHAPYHPDKFIEAIRQAAEADYKVIILDSMTHAWNGEGGLLELVEQATKRQKTPNSYTAWHDVTPIQNKLIEAIVSANIHIIATMRSKQEYVQEKDNNGRSTIRKVGMAPIQRDGFEYEFDVFFDMDIDNNAVVSKTRCPEMTGKVYSKPGAQVAKILKNWLGGAPVPEPKKKPADENFYNASATSQQPQERAEGNNATPNPFDDSTAFYARDWRQLTGPRYDLVRDMAELHDQSDGPCTPKQYQYLTGIIDALTNKQHNYVLSLLCQSEIHGANMPGRKVAGTLLKFLPETVMQKDSDGKPVKDADGKNVMIANPDYRADMAEIIGDLAQPILEGGPAPFSADDYLS